MDEILFLPKFHFYIICSRTMSFCLNKMPTIATFELETLQSSSCSRIWVFLAKQSNEMAIKNMNCDQTKMNPKSKKMSSTIFNFDLFISIGCWHRKVYLWFETLSLYLSVTNNLYFTIYEKEKRSTVIKTNTEYDF